MSDKKTPQKITDIVDYCEFEDFMLLVQDCHNLVFDTDIFSNFHVSDYDDIDVLRSGCIIALNHIAYTGDFYVPVQRERLIINEHSSETRDLIRLILAHYLNWLNANRNDSCIWWYDKSEKSIKWINFDDFKEVFVNEAK